MNAALQCLSNTRELRDYFLRQFDRSIDRSSSSQFRLFRVAASGRNESAQPVGNERRDGRRIGLGDQRPVGGRTLVHLRQPTSSKRTNERVEGETLRFSSGFSGETTSRVRRQRSTRCSRIVKYCPRRDSRSETKTKRKTSVDKFRFQDLNRIIHKPLVPPVEDQNRPDEIVAQEFWEGYLKRNDSIVVQLFTGQFKSKTKCPQCHKVKDLDLIFLFGSRTNFLAERNR